MEKKAEKKTQNIINTSRVNKKKISAKPVTSLFPPADGPVYQFSPPLRDAGLCKPYFQSFEGEGIPFRESSAFCGVSCSQMDGKGFEIESVCPECECESKETETVFKPASPETINALEELRNLVDVVRRGEVDGEKGRAEI